MADLFDAYEEDFQEVRNNIERRITNIPTLDGASRQNAIQQTEAEITEAEQILRSMNLSARNVSTNQSLLARIKDYEAEIAKLKSNLRKSTMQFKATNDRDQLFSGLRDEHVASSMDQREKLLAGTERLERSHVELQNSIREADETVRIGIEVMDNLDNQRSTMYRIKDRLSNVNSQVKHAGRIMTRMSRRAIANKLIMAVIILVLLGAVVLVVYLKWFSGGEDPAPATQPAEQTTD